MFIGLLLLQKRLYHNLQHLHSAIGYDTPNNKLYGRAETVQAKREEELEQAGQRRKEIRNKDQIDLQNA